MPGSERLFTARFALMFGFSFTVFLSAFQLFPTAPFQILALGGTSTEAGLFLGLLTYASAVSAPLMGGVADRIGKRRILFVCSIAIAVFSALYAVVPSYQLMLGLVIVHGLFWAGLLSASGAYVTDTVPPARRAEGLSYWGFASIIAVSVAPSIGLVGVRARRLDAALRGGDGPERPDGPHRVASAARSASRAGCRRACTTWSSGA